MNSPIFSLLRGKTVPLTPAQRARVGTVAGGVGIATNLLLSAGKFVAGALSGSVSITADAANNLSDAGSSLLTMVGFRLSAKPADREHPYGHARYEYLTGLAISFLVLLLGLSFLKESVLSFFGDSQTVIGNLALIILALSIGMKLWQWWFYRRVARGIDSESLKASAADSLSDVVMTAVVLVGALLRRFLGWEADGIIGSAVAVVIIISGVRLIMETSGSLLGKAPDPELVLNLRQMVLSYAGVISIHDLMIHSYGAGKLFASLHAEVDARADMMDCHDLIDNIELEVGKALGLELVIHLDPVTLNDPKIDAMKEQIATILYQISPKLSYHDFRVVFGPTHDNVLFDVVVPTGFVLPDEELERLITHSVKECYPSAVTKLRIDHDYSNFLDE